MSIKVWGRETCSPCKTVKYWLTKKNYDYEVIDVDQNMKEFQKLGFTAVPVIEVDGVHFTNLPSLASHLQRVV